MNEKRPQSGETLAEMIQQIKTLAAGFKEKPRLMEVCGTHTVAIFRQGIRSLLEESVDLLSGPGCPVCVTPDQLIDQAIAYARKGFIIASFGDMLRVPGSCSSLLTERAAGAEIFVVTSPLNVVDLAQANPSKTVIFLAVGFETTSPGTALLLERARDARLDNLKLLVGHKAIPPAMEVLLSDPEQKISGFICPGHVATIIGTQPFQLLSNQFKTPCVIAGFEGADILLAIWMLLRQLKEGRADTENQYRRGVRNQGNPLAQQLVNRYFETADSDWRGFDIIAQSGLQLRPAYQEWDANIVIPVQTEKAARISGCSCGAVLRGKINPRQCPLFGAACTPQTPVGPCMVSGEGVCLTQYRYGQNT